MESSSLFPGILSDYKKLLLCEGVSSISLSRYCRGRMVSYKSITQWMQRHGVHVSSLKTEALIEKYGSVPPENTFSSQPTTELTPIDMLAGSKRGKNMVQSPPLTGLTLTFPDGMIISIKEAPAESLSKFIECYNKNTPSCLP